MLTDHTICEPLHACLDASAGEALASGICCGAGFDKRYVNVSQELASSIWVCSVRDRQLYTVLAVLCCAVCNLAAPSRKFRSSSARGAVRGVGVQKGRGDHS